MKNIYKLFTIGFLSLLFISTVKAQSKPTEYLSVGKKVKENKTFEKNKWWEFWK